MVTVSRLKSEKEGWLKVAKILYMVIALPCALIIGIPSLFIASSLIKREAYFTIGLCTLAWLAVLVPILVVAYGVVTRRRLLKNIVASVKSPNFFWPESEYQVYHEGDGKYFGIDIARGTLLYVHQIRKGAVDVVGLTMSDWTDREVDGSVLRLYTKYPNLPRIEISTPWAQRWFDTLGAMQYKNYSTPTPFSAYVAEHIETIEQHNGIHIPHVA